MNLIFLFGGSLIIILSPSFFSVCNVEVNKESTGLKEEECNAVRSQRKNKEVRKRLDFLNVNEKKIDFIKDDIDECYPEHLSLTEEITTPRKNNNPDASEIDFTSSENCMKTDTRKCKEVAYERNLQNVSKNNVDLCIDSASEKTTQTYEEENFETLIEDEEDVCNMTFTQYLSKKIESELDQPNCASLETASGIARNKSITIITKFNPPSRERIISSMKMYDISGCKSTGPFFSNKIDLIKQKENSNKNNSISDLVPFKSSLDRITGIKLWRRVKINEFYPSGANIKSCDVRRVLAGYNSVMIQPLIQPPTSKSVRIWLQAKKYLSKKNNKRLESKSKSDRNLSHEKKIIDRVNSEERNESIVDRNKSVKEQSQTSNTSQCSSKSSGSLNPSLQQMLENPLLYKNNTPQHLGISYGQLEYSMSGHSGNASKENLQNARGLTVVNILFYTHF